MGNVLLVLGLSGLILIAVNIIRMMIFKCKILPILIDELNKNLYCDVADKVQEMIDCPMYGTFREDSAKWQRLEREAINLFVEITIPPEQTKLYADQRFFKVTVFLFRLGVVMFFFSIFLRFISG